MFDNGKDENEERYTSKMLRVRLLDCNPANLNEPEGPPAVTIVIDSSGEIEPMAFPLRDSRKIVVRLLVALATFDDAFALKLLDDHFAVDKDDEYIWPRNGDDDATT